MAESWLICENGYTTKCEDCPIRDENAEPCEHAIEVAPVWHGRWIRYGADKRGRGGIFRCSACEKSYPYVCDYCPNCGARMDGAE